MKFLIAIDGSQVSQKAVEKALSLAVPTQAQVVLLTVVEPISSYAPQLMMPTGDWVGWQGTTPDIEMEKTIMAAGRSLLEKNESICQAAGIECQTRLEIGSPRDTICLIAAQEGADFLVMGSRGLGNVERMMLGSVSDYVAHHSPCPIIIVR